MHEQSLKRGFPNIRKWVLAAEGVQSSSASEYHNKSTKVIQKTSKRDLIETETLQKESLNTNAKDNILVATIELWAALEPGALHGGDRPHKGALHSRRGLVPAMGESDDRKVTWTQLPVYI